MEFEHTPLWRQIEGWAHALGFSQIGVAPVDLRSAEPGLQAWLGRQFHGEMAYMAEHGLKRARPAELIPGTLCVLTARMNYLDPDTPHDWQAQEWQRLQTPGQGVVSLYARGRDYHKVLRNRLDQLARQIDQALAALAPPQRGEATQALQYRAFTDSAPVLEAELATRSGLGWRGKHTLVLHRDAGSMFFLGEIYLNQPWPQSPPISSHCGECRACIDHCPTGAILGPGQLDARRCISYLTIEHPGSIAPELRPLMGAHVYGCDDCQLACPWNKYAKPAGLADFRARPQWTEPSLADWLRWDEDTFLRQSEGSPIRRIGHTRWLRNVAIASGNALRPPCPLSPEAQADLLAALEALQNHAHPLVREHVAWALAQV